MQNKNMGRLGQGNKLYKCLFRVFKKIEHAYREEKNAEIGQVFWYCGSHVENLPIYGVLRCLRVILQNTRERCYDSITDHFSGRYDFVLVNFC